MRSSLVMNTMDGFKLSGNISENYLKMVNLANDKGPWWVR